MPDAPVAALAVELKTCPASGPAGTPRRIGFHGKIPARGDFVWRGLPGSFLRPWNAWVSQILVESRLRLGASWPEAWHAGTPCRFFLAAGVCGPDPAAGAWLPSFDRVGRAYPLTLATVGHGCGIGDFLAHAEAVGRVAVAECLEPAAIAARLAEEHGASTATGNVSIMPESGGLWCWAGSSSRPLPRLPNAAAFAAMLSIPEVAL